MAKSEIMVTLPSEQQIVEKLGTITFMSLHDAKQFERGALWLLSCLLWDNTFKKQGTKRIFKDTESGKEIDFLKLREKAGAIVDDWFHEYCEGRCEKDEMVSAICELAVFVPEKPERQWGSKEVVGDVDKIYESCQDKFDWRSYYNGWIDGRVDMLSILRGWKPSENERFKEDPDEFFKK
jgi:hypothetical protein